MFCNAQVILARCNRSKRLYGIRLQEERDKTWRFTWSYPIDESRAKSEGFDRSISNIMFGEYDDDYPGCPYCHADGFIRCSCGKLTCMEGNESSCVCAWCGTYMDDFVNVDQMELGIGDD